MPTPRTPFYLAIDPQKVGSGLQPDMHDIHKVLWAEAESVSFQHGRVRRRKPATLAITVDSAKPIRGISQLQDSNGVRWIWGNAGDLVKRWYGPSVDLIDTYTNWSEDQGVLYNASFTDFVPYGDWMVFNNSRNTPRVYKPSGPSVGALGNIATAITTDIVTMMKKFDFMLAIGYGADKRRVGWSDSGDIEEWVPATDNAADSLTIDEFDTPIRAAARMGDAIAIYCEDQMAHLNYVGDPFWFGYKAKLDGIGAVGKRAVASDGRINVGVSRNGVWWTDGISFRYIDEGFLRTYLQDNVNWDQASKIVAARNDVSGCFEFSFPTGASDDPSEAWGFDPRTGAWYEVPVFSDKDERRLFDRPLLGSLDGKIYYDEDASSDNSLVLKTKPLLAMLQTENGMIDIHNAVHCQYIDVMLKTASNIQMRIGSCNEPGGTYTYSTWIDLLAGYYTYPVPRGVPSGVYHKLEFQSTSTTWDMDLQGFMLFGNVEGVKREFP